MSVLAVTGGTSSVYKLMFLLHILSVVVGFGSAFVYPVLGREAQVRRGIQAQALSDASLKAAGILTTPPIWIAGLTGVALVLMSEPFDFDEAWISIAMTLFILAAALATFVHVPNLRRMNVLTSEVATAGTPDPAQVAELQRRGKRAAMFGGILHLLFLALLVDMIWKPG